MKTSMQLHWRQRRHNQDGEAKKTDEDISDVNRLWVYDHLWSKVFCKYKIKEEESSKASLWYFDEHGYK